jgi:hypothetical protein
MTESASATFISSCRQAPTKLEWAVLDMLQTQSATIRLASMPKTRLTSLTSREGKVRAPQSLSSMESHATFRKFKIHLPHRFKQTFNNSRSSLPLPNRSWNLALNNPHWTIGQTTIRTRINSSRRHCLHPCLAQRFFQLHFRIRQSLRILTQTNMICFASV